MLRLGTVAQLTRFGAEVTRIPLTQDSGTAQVKGCFARVLNNM